MSVKVDGRWCAHCNRVVMAQKNGHAVRNTVAVLMTPGTLGLSLAGSKRGKWLCPQCGGPTIKKGLRYGTKSKDMRRAIQEDRHG
jgi:predicted RNA-binding Zn-ribbon protein involved in translation (DUF1610 family)